MARPRRLGTAVLCTLVVLGALTPGLAGGVIEPIGDGGAGATGATASITATTATTARTSCVTLTLDGSVTNEITSAGCYVIGSNVTNATADPLLRVAAGDVTIKGDDKILDGQDNNTAIRTDPSVAPSTVTIGNLTLADWEHGIELNGTTGTVVENVTVIAGSEFGIGLGSGTSDTTVRDTVVEGMGRIGVGVAPPATSNTLQDLYIVDVESGPGVRIDGDTTRLDNVTVRGSPVGLAIVGAQETYGSGVDVSDTGTGVYVSGDSSSAATDTELASVTALDTTTAFKTEIGPSGTPNTNNTFQGVALHSSTTIDIEDARSVTVEPRSSPPPVPDGLATLGPSLEATALATDAYLDLDVRYDESAVDGFREQSIRLWQFNDTGASFVVGDNEVVKSGNFVAANATTLGVLAPLGISDEAVMTNRSVDSNATASHTLRTAFLNMSGGGATNTVQAVFNDSVAGNLTLDGVTATDLDGSESFSVSNTGVVDGPDGDGLLDTLTADVSTTQAPTVDARIDFAATVEYPSVSSDTTIPVDRRLVDGGGNLRTGPWANVTVLAPDGGTTEKKEPDIDVSTRSLGFGSVVVNRSRTATLTISNEGKSGLSVSEIDIDGPDEVWFSVDAGSFFLDAGESRTVTVTFAPTATGVADGTVVIGSDDPDQSRVEVALDGIAVTSDMSVNASRNRFGATPIGTTATERLVVRNDGAANLTVDSITVDGPNATAFGVDRASLTVPSTAERALNVTFSPDQPGPKRATLSLSSAAGTTIEVELAGNGTRSRLSVPSSLSFEPTPVGSTRTRALRVENDGGSPIELTDVATSGGNATAFSAARDTLTVPANGSERLRITFGPTAAGPANATLSLRGPAGRRNVTLAGRGRGPRLSVTPATVGFGRLAVGTNTTAQLTVANTGGGSLNVTGLSLSGPGAGAFAVGEAPRTLAAGQQRALNVTFAPTDRGRQTATLSVATDAGRATVPLNGTGADVNLSVSSRALAFGSTTPARPVTRIVTITNRGPRSVSLTSLSVRGARAFAVATDAPLSVPAGASRTVRVRFRPRTDGPVTATLAIGSNETGVATRRVSLRGTATVPDVRVTPGSLTFGTVAVEEAVTRNLTVVNEGTATLTVEDVTLTSGIEPVVDVGATSPIRIEPGDRRSVPITFRPTARRPYSGTLQLVTDDPDEPVVPIWLSNSNTTATLSLQADRNRTNFSANVSNVEPGSEVGFDFGGGNGTGNGSAAELTGVSVRFRSAADGATGRTTPGAGAALAVPTTATPARQSSGEAIDFTLEATSSATPLAGTPTFRTPANGTVGLRYVDVRHSFPNSAVSNASLTFRVDRDRIESLRGTDPEDVVVYRYVNGSWVERPTEIVAQREGTLVLRATADGFSDWTVGAKQASFDVVRADVSVTSVTTGDSVNINVRIENTGGADGQFLTELLLNDRVVESREVEIAAGGIAQVTFDRAFERPGTYRVRVNDVPAGSVEVSTGGTSGTDGSAGTTTGTSSGTGDGFGLFLAGLVATLAGAVAGRWHARQ